LSLILHSNGTHGNKDLEALVNTGEVATSKPLSLKLESILSFLLQNMERSDEFSLSSKTDVSHG
jgi:hypothetical protein